MTFKKETPSTASLGETAGSANGASHHESAVSTNPGDSASAPAKKIRYAVVGLGHIAQVAVLPGFERARNAELVALVSGDREKLKALKKKYQVRHTYSYQRFDECLANPEIDAVYIALPNDLHADCVIRAARAGKHILCEKPLALHEREIRQMAAAARAGGVRLMTAYRLHFEPANLSAIELVRSGKLGEPRYFNSTFSYQVTDTNNIRLKLERGGGPVYDIGTYCINAARYLMQDEPIEVSAMIARTDDTRFDEVEESAAVLLRFPRGRLASFVVSFGAANCARYELVGTKGSIALDPAYEYSEALHQTVTIDDESEEKTFDRTDQFGGEIEAFAKCLLEDCDPEPSLEEGLADVRIIEAIFESAERGCSIRLRPVKKSARPGRHQMKRKQAVRKPDLVKVTSPHGD
ncbi:MAG: putative glucose-fructose oxidoreductase oxidoreductase protein [Verrucomicrobia bacterium]|nr:putative glucose-fructose oxidoreductase oxidoreductase protein [Verrucomicrobiota bacterium]